MYSTSYTPMKSPAQSSLWPYKHFEKTLRVCMAVVAAHIIVVNGTNYSIFTLLLIKGYYIEMGFSVMVALIIIGWVNHISNRLDRRYPWEEHLLSRTVLQFLLGIIVPTLIEFFMVALYFWSLARINVLKTPFMNREFRLVILMICFFNLYCLARYFYIKWRITENEFDLYRKGLVPTMEEAAEPDTEQLLPALEETKEASMDAPTNVFIVHTVTRSYPVPIDEVAYFYRSNGHVFLRPFSGADAILSQSLDQIESQLVKQAFFRVARHMIISHKSVVDYRPLNFGKVGITLRPAYREPVTASKIQAHDFRLWLRAGSSKTDT